MEKFMQVFYRIGIMLVVSIFLAMIAILAIYSWRALFVVFGHGGCAS